MERPRMPMSNLTHRETLLSLRPPPEFRIPTIKKLVNLSGQLRSQYPPLQSAFYPRGSRHGPVSMAISSCVEQPCTKAGILMCLETGSASLCGHTTLL